MLEINSLSFFNSSPVSTQHIQIPKTLNERSKDSLIKEKISMSTDFSSLEEKKIEHKSEKLFIENPNYSDYLKIAKNFHLNYQNLDNPSFICLDEFTIQSSNIDDFPKIRDYPYINEQIEHEKWLKESNTDFIKQMKKENFLSTLKKEKQIEEKCHLAELMSNISYRIKEGGIYVKKNFTLRGNMSTLNDDMFGKSLYELLPNYKSRKLAKLGIKISESSLKCFLTVAGNLLVPVTLGISKIASDQTKIAVTLTSESIEKKINGASDEKIATNVLFRGIQLELPHFIPVIGNAIELADDVFEITGTTAIISSKIADLILGTIFLEYQEKIPKKDFGDPKVLVELDNRINYLSKFLIPFGQYLYTQETKEARKNQLQEIIKIQLEFLRTLERRKTKTLQFYQLALIANRTPEDFVDYIKLYINKSDSNNMNGHITARSCLATLLNNKSQNI